MNPGSDSCIESSGVNHMRNQKLYRGIAAFFGLFVLILDGKTALAGATEGIVICIQTVIPAIFPFFVISAIITSTFSGVSIPVLRPIGKRMNLPIGTESILICSYLGGYPVGAQAVAEAYRKGQISKSQAEHLLPCCNNPGPSFLFGMVSFLFPDKHSVWLLWGIIILSSLITLTFSPADYVDENSAFTPKRHEVNIMLDSIKAMGCVCGWIILFRVMIAFIARWFLWIWDDDVQILIIGLMELSNGCYELSKIADHAARFLICGCILSFGGICVTMQTASVISPLSMKYYWQGKLIQTAATAILCFSVLYKLWVILIAAILFVFIPWNSKNRSRFPRKAIV